MRNTAIRPVQPGPGQESVWDYPRPPRLEPVRERLRADFAGETIADTTNGFRVLETSHPPVYYIPRTDIRADVLADAPGQSYCEFKGVARYWTLSLNGQISMRAGWSYPTPTLAFAAIRDHIAFYASCLDACWVGDEQVQAQQGDFYGGWITSKVVGPFKGAPGTMGW
jgi:uncharacterized protein (DUF427 family)